MNALWQRFEENFSGTILNIPTTQWVAFLAITILLFLILRIGVTIARRRLKSRVEKTKNVYDDYLLRLLEHTWTLGLLSTSVFLALYFVELKAGETKGADTVEKTVRTLALLGIFIQFGVWGNSLIDVALHRGFRYANFSETAAQTAFGVVRFFALVALWTSVAILILSAFGVEITPLLAGLGVGGITVGFALQKILGDIFCSVAIVLDRPFEVGDFIINGEYMGAVERIGVKTTRVRSLGGEQIIFPNSDLLDSRVRNYKRMAERRVVFAFGVLYATPPETLEAIPGLVKQIIEEIDQTRFDRAHFASFGDSALNFEVVYYVLSPDFNLYMDIQQTINLALVRRLAERGVEFAFPSRTLYVEGTDVPLKTEVRLHNGPQAAE